MSRFLMLIAAAVVLAVVAFVLHRRAPKGWTRFFLGLAAVSALAFPLGVLAHNLVEGVFHVEEPVFFLVAVAGAPVGIVVGFVGAAVAGWLSRAHLTS